MLTHRAPNRRHAVPGTHQPLGDHARQFIGDRLVSGHVERPSPRGVLAEMTDICVFYATPGNPIVPPFASEQCPLVVCMSPPSQINSIDPSQNHLLAALTPAERERIVPHL